MFKADDHFIYSCIDFLYLSILNRIKQASHLNLCRNCLRNNHENANCKSNKKYRKCNLRHNTLRHKSKVVSNTNDTNSDDNHVSPSTSIAHCLNVKKN